MPRSNPESIFAICVNSDGCDVDLQTRRLYQVVQPERNDPSDYIRVIDESGEDYLYPADCFIVIELPKAEAQRLRSVIAQAA